MCLATMDKNTGTHEDRPTSAGRVYASNLVKHNVEIAGVQASTSLEAKENVEPWNKKVLSPQVAPSPPIDENEKEILEDDLLPPAPRTPSRFKPSAILGAPGFELPISPSKSLATTRELPISPPIYKAIARKPVSAQDLSSLRASSSVPRSSSTAIIRKPVSPIDMSVLTNSITAPITSASSFPSITTRASQHSSRETSDYTTIGANSTISLLKDVPHSLEHLPTLSTTTLDETERSRPARRNTAPKSGKEEEDLVESLVAAIQKLQATIVILEAHAADYEDFDFKWFTPFGTPLDAFIENRAPAELLQHVRSIVSEVQSNIPSKQAKETDASKTLSKAQKKNKKKRDKKQEEQQLAEDMKLSKEEAIIHASEHAQEVLDKAMEQLQVLDYAKFKVNIL